MTDKEWSYIDYKVSQFKEHLRNYSYSPSKSNFKVKYLTHNMTSPMLNRYEYKHYSIQEIDSKHESMLSAARSDDDSNSELPLKVCPVE